MGLKIFGVSSSVHEKELFPTSKDSSFRDNLPNPDPLNYEIKQT